MTPTTIKHLNSTPTKSEGDAPRIYVIHENATWVEPLRDALHELKLPYEEWFINSASIDINDTPPEGIFYNRMSASSHTRDNRWAVESTGPAVAWLQAHGRKVLNGRRALQLEVRKFEQYLELNRFGLKTPRTVAAVTHSEIIAAAKTFAPEPFIIKPNRGGKGLDVQLFNTVEALEDFLATDPAISLDGITLVQQYVRPADASITRMEFIGGKFYYAVRVDTSEGFELCPADSCQVGDAMCPAGPEEEVAEKRAKFELIANYENPDIPRAELFLAANQMDVAAIEYVETAEGERYIYDVNINTNYNAAAERAAGNDKRGMFRIAQHLGEQLEELKAARSKQYRKAIWATAV